jgi:hypothetical protein
MPKYKNPLLSTEFTQKLSINSKMLMLACKHCKWTGTNTTRTIEHFSEDDCPGDPAKASSEQFGQLTKRQATLLLEVLTISQSKKQKLDSLAVQAVYIGTRLFCLWDNLYIAEFVDLLGDHLYKAPNRN